MSNSLRCARLVFFASVLFIAGGCGSQYVENEPDGSGSTGDAATVGDADTSTDSATTASDGSPSSPDAGPLAGSFAASLDQVVTYDSDPASPMISQVGIAMTVAAGPTSDAHVSFTAAGVNQWAFDANRDGDALTFAPGQVATIASTDYTVVAPSTLTSAGVDAVLSLRLRTSGSNPQSVVLRGTLVRTH